MSALLKECPFCGATAHIESNRDWHRLYAAHSDECVFGNEEETLMYPATPDGLKNLAECWNARASAPPVAAGSVDINADGHFDALLSGMHPLSASAVTAFVNDWGAQQREAGRLEGKASNETLLRASVNEMDAMERERDEARQHARDHHETNIQLRAAEVKTTDRADKADCCGSVEFCERAACPAQGDAKQTEAAS